MIVSVIAAGCRPHWLVLLLLVVVVPVRSECVPGTNGFEAWPEDEPMPVASIPRYNWYRDALGWIVAPDRCQAIDAAVERRAAVEAFQRYFDRPAPYGAVVDVEFAASMDKLSAAGAVWVLPWQFVATDAKRIGDEQVAAIRSQVEAQLAAGGETPDPAQVDAIVQQALAALSGADPEPGATPLAELEQTVVRHEVGHLLFIHAIWPPNESTGSELTDSQYGGGAPDWLDEAAAVAAESPAMTAARREAFRTATAEKQLTPLKEYFTMPHPVFASPEFSDLMNQTRAAAAQDGAAVMAMSIDDAAVAKAARFYAQTRGLLDYLELRAGEPTVLGNIADALLAGTDIQQWLAKSGVDAGLPANLETLEADFRAWAESGSSGMAEIGVNSD